MRCLCEIGIIVILIDTSLISTYLLPPRIDHLHQALHVFKYLKDHKHSKCAFDPNYLDIMDNHMPVKDQEIYRS